MDKIGIKIRTLRLQERKRQFEIAKLLGISVPAFSKIENGISDVSSDRLIQLAHIFNVKVSYFFEDIGPTSQVLQLEEDLKQKIEVIEQLQLKLIRCMEENFKLMASICK